MDGLGVFQGALGKYQGCPRGQRIVPGVFPDIFGVSQESSWEFPRGILRGLLKGVLRVFLDLLHSLSAPFNHVYM
jgi:hypothetical protein